MSETSTPVKVPGRGKRRSPSRLGREEATSHEPSPKKRRVESSKVSDETPQDDNIVIVDDEQAVPQPTVPPVSYVAELIASAKDRAAAWKAECEDLVEQQVAVLERSFLEKTKKAVEEMAMRDSFDQRELCVELAEAKAKFEKGKPEKDKYVIDEALRRFKERNKENLCGWEVHFSVCRCGVEGLLGLLVSGRGEDSSKPMEVHGKFVAFLRISTETGGE